MKNFIDIKMVLPFIAVTLMLGMFFGYLVSVQETQTRYKAEMQQIQEGIEKCLNQNTMRQNLNISEINLNYSITQTNKT